MFLIGCAECRDSQIPCVDKIDAMVNHLRHERDAHPKRWNQTKAQSLNLAERWQAVDISANLIPQGATC